VSVIDLAPFVEARRRADALRAERLSLLQEVAEIAKRPIPFAKKHLDMANRLARIGALGRQIEEIGQ
jgi:hypothetical protein